MPRVRLTTDPFDLGSYSEHDVPELLPFLREQFPIWPETARLYKGRVSKQTDVTPRCEADLAELTGDGTFYVVVYPGDPVTLTIAIAVAVFVISAVVFMFLMPKMPGQSAGNTDSSNNSLGNRVNKPRPNERIPDIFGKIKAIPELLTYPLVLFEANVEFEICFMCIGRGEYDLNADLVFDGQTPLDNIAGAGAKFYGPFTRPGNGVPVLEIGDDIGFDLLGVVKSNEVNGQKLKPPNANQITGQGDIRFTGPDTIEANPTSTIDFTKYFNVGDDLTISGADFGGIAVFDATTQICRFYSDKRIEFQTFDPSTLYRAGELLVVSNGGFVGVDSVSGAAIFVDVSGTYTIVSVNGPSKIIQLG
jgi:hypothetical protein